MHRHPQPPIERRIQRATLDQLMQMYASENQKRQEAADRIFTTLGELTKDESLELSETWEQLDNDCQELATAIADRLTDPTHTHYKELTYA